MFLKFRNKLRKARYCRIQEVYALFQQNGSFMGFLSHDDILRHFGSLFTQVSQMINQTKGTAGAPC